MLGGIDEAFVEVSGVLGRKSDRDDCGSRRCGEGMGTGGTEPGIGCKRSRLAEGLSAMFSRLGRLRRFPSIDGRRPRPACSPGGGVPIPGGPKRGEGGGIRPSPGPALKMAGSPPTGMGGGPGRLWRGSPSAVGGRGDPRGGGGLLSPGGGGRLISLSPGGCGRRLVSLSSETLRFA